MQYIIDDNIQASGENKKKCYSKIDKQESKLDNNVTIIRNMMDKNQNYNYLPGSMYLPKDQGHTTVVPANKRDLPLEGVHSTKNGCMWALKHEIISPKFYELLINT